jgi:hypothetical protein
MSATFKNDIILEAALRRVAAARHPQAARRQQLSDALIAALVLLCLVPLGVWLLFFIGTTVGFGAFRHGLSYFIGYCIGLASLPLFIIKIFSCRICRQN